MSRVTIAGAEEAANQICKKLDAQIKKIEDEIKEMLIHLHEKSIPQAVKDVYKKYPEYFKTITRLHASGVGISGKNRISADLTESCSYSHYLELKDKDLDRYTKLINKRETLQEKRDKTFLEIKNTLLGLGTYKRVQASFPEALKYLPQISGGVTLMHVPEKIRETVSCLISTDEKCLQAI
jgi:paraquat-inducible protein B